MGTALVRGLRGRAGERLARHRREGRSRRSELECELPGVIVSGVRVEAASVVFAVKPADAEGACRGYVGTTAERVLSIMAGVTTARIDAWLGGHAAVIRAMPNTPAFVGAGVSAVAPGPRTTGEDLAWAESVLGSVGMVVRVEESDLDAVTGLSGSGPAYVFLLVEALARAGSKAGLDPATSRVLARQTVIGAGRLLDESHDDPSRAAAPGHLPRGRRPRRDLRSSPDEGWAGSSKRLSWRRRSGLGSWARPHRRPHPTLAYQKLVTTIAPFRRRHIGVQSSLAERGDSTDKRRPIKPALPHGARGGDISTGLDDDRLPAH